MTWEPELWWGGCGHVFRKLDTCVGVNKVVNGPSCQVTTRKEVSIGTKLSLVLQSGSAYTDSGSVGEKAMGQEEALSVQTPEVTTTT